MKRIFPILTLFSLLAFSFSLTHAQIHTGFTVKTGVYGYVQLIDGEIVVWTGPQMDSLLQIDTSGGLGLINWWDTASVTWPNITRKASVFLAKGALFTDIDAVIQPVGVGALLGNTPDGTSVGGNKRGQYAVDWGLVRSDSTHVAFGDYSVIGGGYNNMANGSFATVPGGANNFVYFDGGTIGGGSNNIDSATYSTIVGGSGNIITGQNSVVGGDHNSDSSDVGTIFGSQNVIADSGATYATISGGNANRIDAQQSTIAGGFGNAIRRSTSSGSVISGGNNNAVRGEYSVIAGGQFNIADKGFSAIAGGRGLTLFGSASFGFLGDSDGSNNMSISAPNTAIFANTNLWLGNNNNIASSLYFYAPYASSGAFPGADKYVAFHAGVVTTSVNYRWPLADGLAGWTLHTDGSANLYWDSTCCGGGGGGSGTVTSVALTAPSEISVAGSPITTSGTLALTWANETTNKVFAAPNGSTGTPTFRLLVAADIPALSYVTSVALTMPSIFSVSGSPVTSSGTLAATLNTQNANLVFAGPTSGGAAIPIFRSLVAADVPALGYVTSVDASGGTTGLTFTGGPITSSGTLTLSGVLAIANGGTGANDTNFAFQNLNPMRLLGDIIADDVLNTPVRIAGNVTTTPKVLTSVGGGSVAFLPAWTDPLTLITGVPYRLYYADGTGALAQIPLPADTNMVLSGGSTTGAPYFSPHIILGVGGTGFEGSVEIHGLTSGFVNLRAPSTTTSYNFFFPNSVGSPNQVLTTDGTTGIMSWTTAGSGSVTSVALTMPSIFSVSGSPVTSSGTFGVTLQTQNANLVFAGPTSGGAATPTFRALVAADIPSGIAIDTGTILTHGIAGSVLFLGNTKQIAQDNGHFFYDSTHHLLDLIQNGIGTTSTDGLLLTNTTAAAVGAQQYSPRLRLRGNGWATGSGGSSKTADWIVEVKPSQSTLLSNQLWFSSSINNAGYAQIMGLTSDAPLGSGLVSAVNGLLTSLTGANGTIVYYSNSSSPTTGDTKFTYNGNGLLSIGGSPQQASIALKGGTSGTVTLSTIAAAGTYTMRLPNSMGTSTQVLTTNGVDSLYWSTGGGGGGGTVTSVALSGTNGIAILSGSPITTSGTIALGITNGSIGDSSLASTFLKANQTITLSGDVTGSGTTAITTAIGNNKVTTATINASAVTLAKIANASSNSILVGSGASGSGSAYSEIALGTGLTMTGTTLSATGSGGTVTTLSVVSANGFAGSVANATTTPAITLTTTVTGLLKGNGTAISAASSGTDYTLLSGLTNKGAVYATAANAITSTTGMTDGQLLIGSTSGNPALATITGTSNEITVTNGSNTITLATPQAIATGSSPTFAGLTLSSPLTVANGGTGAATLTAHAVLLGEGTSAIAATSTGTAGQAIISAGSGADPDYGGVARTYAVTLGVDSNTSAENALLQATIPANEWLDHQTIRFTFILVSKNNTGSTQSFTPRVYWGANAFSFGGQSVATSASIGTTLRNIWCTRVGTSIYITNTQQTGTLSTSLTGASYSSTSGGSLSSQTFTASTVIKFTNQFSNANGENYWSCIGGCVVKE